MLKITSKKKIHMKYYFPECYPQFTGADYFPTISYFFLEKKDRQKKKKTLIQEIKFISSRMGIGLVWMSKQLIKLLALKKNFLTTLSLQQNLHYYTRELILHNNIVRWYLCVSYIFPLQNYIILYGWEDEMALKKDISFVWLVSHINSN